MIIRKDIYKKPMGEIIDVLVDNEYDVFDTINTLQTILHEVRRYPLAEKIATHAPSLRSSCT